ncbi:hypothetical protein BDN70DRAFT_869950, partial [Pholiota conissans]
MSALILEPRAKKLPQRGSLEKDSDIIETAYVTEEVPKLGAPLQSAGSGIGFSKAWKPVRILDLDAIATQPSVFDNPITLEIYRPPPQYENTHLCCARRWKERMRKRGNEGM